jgi:hypothetical protein
MAQKRKPKNVEENDSTAMRCSWSSREAKREWASREDAVTWAQALGGTLSEDVSSQIKVSCYWTQLKGGCCYKMLLAVSTFSDKSPIRYHNHPVLAIGWFNRLVLYCKIPEVVILNHHDDNVEENMFFVILLSLIIHPVYNCVFPLENLW